MHFLKPTGAEVPHHLKSRARLYDGTVAADYYRAMGEVEVRMALVEGAEKAAPDEGQLLALVDALGGGGTLNGKQKQAPQALREGIMARARQWELVDKVEADC